MTSRVFQILLLTGCFTAELAAGTRLTYEVTGRPVPISWSLSAFPIRTTVDAGVMRSLPGSFEKINEAAKSWKVIESDAQFASPVAGASTAGKNGVNSISIDDRLFEESGFLAYTTTWFDDSGRIQEADIQIDSQSVGGYDLQSLVGHEYGHLLGLDHSGVIGAVMYPYVSKTTQALDSDDRVTLASIYPSAMQQSANATIRGSVKSKTGPVFGAQVVAVSAAGIAVASTLSDEDGAFVLKGLPEGSYRIYAEPLDGPVDREHLSGVWRGVSKSGFVTKFADPQTILAKSGSSEQVVNLVIPDGASTLNPRWIGLFASNAAEVRLSSTAVTLSSGETSIAVGGDGFVGGVTTFELLAPGIERVSDFRYGPNYVHATFRVSPSVSPGSIAIIARNGNETATLTGALRAGASTAAKPRARGGRG